MFWFQGRMEWACAWATGAVGGSASRGHAGFDQHEVKLQEPFRPFAPSVLEERASEYFELVGPSPFMLRTAGVQSSMKGVIPAVVHVDGTAKCRLSTRLESTVPAAPGILRRRTGVPVLLNTSFNVNEPIVCTPQRRSPFLRTEVEWLVMENLLARRECPSSGPEDRGDSPMSAPSIKRLSADDRSPGGPFSVGRHFRAGSLPPADHHQFYCNR